LKLQSNSKLQFDQHNEATMGYIIGPHKPRSNINGPGSLHHTHNTYICESMDQFSFDPIP